MKRILISTALMIGIAGCSWKPMPNYIDDDSYTENDFSAVCLDGTKYWIYATSHRSFMAVKIDKETRQPVSCDSE